MVVLFNLSKLESVDLTELNNFQDRVLIKFYQNCKKLRKIKIPYHHKSLTDGGVEVVHAYLRDVEVFKVITYCPRTE